MLVHNLIYNKKSSILERLGKDKKDIRYLDRAIERGEVLEIDWYYILKDELIALVFDMLYKENVVLKTKLENGFDKEEELNEAKANVEYYKNEAEEANDKVVALESVLDNLRAKGLDIWYANE